jgi:tetratricopeptide (TPR) repeat protein
MRQGKYEEQVAVYDEIFRRYTKDASPVREMIAKAFYYKGVALDHLEKSAEEIAAYDELVRRYGEDALPDMRELAAQALVNKGVVLERQGKVEEKIAEPLNKSLA